MIYNGSKVSARATALGLLAAVAGSSTLVHAQASSRVFCRFVSASTTRIATQDGYAQALIDIADSICLEATGQPVVVPIDESITAVAFAQAEAIAEVVGTCAGVGSATLQVSARRRAEAQASAIGEASASVLTSSSVCGLCQSGLEAFASAIESVTVNAVAELELDDSKEQGQRQVSKVQADFQFNGEPLTVSVVKTAAQTKIVELLSSITGEIRTSPLDGCSSDALILVSANENFATCDVAISADDIITEIDAIAEAGLSVAAFACDGVDSFIQVELQLREVAVAVAQAVTQASAFCEANGGPGTMACGLSNGTVNAVAQASATAFAEAQAEANGPECNCVLSGILSAEQVASVIAEASASSLAFVCVNGQETAFINDFQIDVEERLLEAISEVISGVAVGVEECSIALGIVAEINPTETP